MNLRRTLFIFILALGGGLTGARAQLVFAPQKWDFGTIAETDGRVSHTFTAENRSDRPIVILDVVTSCGCTVPEFSKRPIRAGEKATVKITYDPRDRPGAFSKEIDVYSSERKRIATLSITGNVTPRAKTVEELYPVDAGGGLRLERTLAAFSFVRQGASEQHAIGYVNTSDRPIRLDLTPKQASGLLSVDRPRTIAPHEKGNITLTCHIATDAPRYGTIRDALDVLVDGRGNGTLLVAHGIGIDAPTGDDRAQATGTANSAMQRTGATGTNARARNSGPAARVQLSQNYIKFGVVKHNAGAVKHPLSITNAGERQLIIRAVETDGRIATSIRPGQRIDPGKTLEAEVAFDPATQDYGVMTDYVVLITNDAQRPMRRVRVSAIVEN